MSRRRVRPEELELWQQVARTARRLTPYRPDKSALFTESLRAPPAKPPVAPQFDAFEIGQKVRYAPPGVTGSVAVAPVAMDKKTFERLRRGKLLPEAKIDLHGMTLEQAHPALTGFILRCHAAGMRLVLVVTGKGKDRDTGGPIPVRPGILRHAVPQWLRLPPLGPLVLQITEAHLKHGGGGAYYVYLRRQR